MKLALRIVRFCSILLLALGFVVACGFDNTLREYLDVHFWLPFSKGPRHFEKANVRRVSRPFAGMVKAAGNMPLEKLRVAYQEISEPAQSPYDPASEREAVEAARSDRSLTRREREEVDLIDAKIDMRSGTPEEPALLLSAQKKLEAFLKAARTPEFLSEARGWLAHIHYLRGDQTAAGKIYLDELNRNGSNLSRETLLNSLQMTYGYDGGQVLLDHLAEYFDAPEHAAFAIQLVTNPRWDREAARYGTAKSPDDARQAYRQINGLLESHSELLKSETGANALAMLTMRTALRMGDPPAALKIAGMVSRDAAIRDEPDFNWMLASAYFLSRDYAAAEQPLLSVFRSSRSSDSQKAAAAYGLCGVYQKNKNPLEQIRYALWLHTAVRTTGMYLSYPSGIRDQSVYWAVSGWDLNTLLDWEAPNEALESFLNAYPDVPDVRLVRYSLAVRLARDNRYDEAAKIYQSIHANRRAPRMRQLASLYREANRVDVPRAQTQEAKFRLAEFIFDHSNGIYFNDALWSGLQRYAMVASRDSRLTGEERQTLIGSERKLKDDQEERWRAYLMLREVMQDAGKTDLGRKAAQLAIRSLRGISERFERQDEIRKADLELSRWLRP